MVIFNQTFKADKKIIFPDNWGRKSIIEEFQQTRKSFSWYVISTITQLLVAFLWIFLLYTIGKGLYELWKVWKEPENSLKRRQYRKVMKIETISSILFIAVSIYLLTVILMIRVQWVREDMFLGLGIWVVLLTIHRAYQILKPPK